MKVGINGFGRIGRLVFRIAIKDPAVEVVAVNDIADPQTLAHLLKYDSTYGILDADVKATESAIVVNGKEYKVLAVRSPEELPWKSLGVEYVVESTGLFRSKDKAAGHIKAGAKKVVDLMDAPPTSMATSTCSPVWTSAINSPASLKLLLNGLI